MRADPGTGQELQRLEIHSRVRELPRGEQTLGALHRDAKRRLAWRLPHDAGLAAFVGGADGFRCAGKLEYRRPNTATASSLFCASSAARNRRKRMLAGAEFGRLASCFSTTTTPSLSPPSVAASTASQDADSASASDGDFARIACAVLRASTKSPRFICARPAYSSAYPPSSASVAAARNTGNASAGRSAARSVTARDSAARSFTVVGSGASQRPPGAAARSVAVHARAARPEVTPMNPNAPFGVTGGTWVVGFQGAEVRTSTVRRDVRFSSRDDA